MDIADILYKFKNYKIRYREKFRKISCRQISRLSRMLIKHPIPCLKQGVLKVMLAMTYRCQCDCLYCCAGKYPKAPDSELGTDEIKSIISEVARLPSLFTLISFFGGEPLLRSDIYYFIEHAARSGLFTEIESNGILLSRDNVARLKKMGLHHVFIRIEGSKEETHDILSSCNGCFQKAIDAIKNCINNDLSCSISTVAIKEKIHNNELKEIIALGKSLGVASVRILYPIAAGNWSDVEAQFLSENEKGYVKCLLEPDFVYLESTYVACDKIDKICPSLQKKLFYISLYGDVQPCPFIPITFGSICRKPINSIIKDMWQSDLFKNTGSCDCPMNNIGFRKNINIDQYGFLT